jgi:glucosyl-dolichyl phosphate glucuronosyltransferase
MTQPQMDISVIICAYTEERWDDLVAAVESVQAQSRAPREIIVVVDHNPNLLARVRMHLPGVIAIENHEPRGLSGARNSGGAAARGAVLAFLDDDAEAAPDWLAQLTTGYTHPDVAGVGGALEPIWRSGQPAWLPEEFYWVVGCTYHGLPQTTAAVRNLIGANMSCRREVFEVVGGFRNGVGQVGNGMLRCDDTEFCIRVRQAQPEYRFLYEPQARVYHQVPSTRTRWEYFRSRCYTEGLSKAVVSRFVGAKDGLASERAYTLRTLPRGVIRGLSDAIRRRDRAGLARAGAIVAGLVITTAGYLIGRVSTLDAARKCGGYDQAQGRAI